MFTWIWNYFITGHIGLELNIQGVLTGVRRNGKHNISCLLPQRLFIARVTWSWHRLACLLVLVIHRHVENDLHPR